MSFGGVSKPSWRLLLAHPCLHVVHSLHATSRAFVQERTLSRIFRPNSANELRCSGDSQIRPIYEEIAWVGKNSMKLRSVESNAARHDAGGLFLGFPDMVKYLVSQVLLPEK